MPNPNERSSDVAPPTGDMSAEEFRRFGHEIVDWIANYFEHIEELPVLAQIEPGDLKARTTRFAAARRRTDDRNSRRRRST